MTQDYTQVSDADQNNWTNIIAFGVFHVGAIAALFLSTEAVIVDKPEEDAPAMPGAGMDDY